MDNDKLSNTFKALSDSTRMRILQMLDKRSRSVNEIVDFFSLTQPTISRHLKVLRDVGLVNAERQGQKIIYSLNVNGLKEIATAYFQSFRCLSKKKSK